MCWKCDHPEASFDDWIEGIRKLVDQRGYTVMYVEGPKPFAYTVGLQSRRLPELLVTGLSRCASLSLLDCFIEPSLEGDPPRPGERTYFGGKPIVEIVEVDHPDVHMGMAMAIASGPITARQAVWADRHGRWPWAPGFDDGHRIQPVLGKRAVQPGGPNGKRAR